MRAKNKLATVTFASLNLFTLSSFSAEDTPKPDMAKDKAVVKVNDTNKLNAVTGEDKIAAKAEFEKVKPAPVVKFDQKPLSKYFSLGVRLGAYGMPKYHAVQLEALYTLNETIRLRIVGGGFYHYFKTLYFNNQTYDNVRLNLKNAGFVVDWHLFKGGIRVSGGIFINKNELHLSKTGAPLPNVPAFISNATTIKSRFKYRLFAPYLGVGYDTPILGKTGLSFSVDAGFLFQGKARAKTHFEGPYAAMLSAGLDAARQQSESVINSHKWLRTLPIITVGIRYNFA